MKAHFFQRTLGSSSRSSSGHHHSPIMVYSWDGVKIVGVSVAGSLFCELVSWILIYRKTSYKTLVASIKRWVPIRSPPSLDAALG